VVPPTALKKSPPPIVAATTVTTGEPWAGSRLYVILAAVLGFGLVVAGESQRRRARRTLAQRRID
jgi:uncharacterized protein HemX